MLSILLTSLTACQLPTVRDPDLSDFFYGISSEDEIFFNNDDKKFSLSFDNTPFGLAMSTITEQSGAVIVWSKDADETVVTGVFDDTEVSSVLTAIAKRVGMQLSNVDGVYFIGTASKGDSVSTVVRLPLSDKEQAVKAFQGCLSDYGRVECFGSCIVVNDYLYNVRKVCQVARDVRERNLKGYIAEVFFLRMKDTQLLDVQARLRVEGIDVFSSSVTLERLFSMYLDVTGTKTGLTLENRPVMYLTEGRKSTLDVGSEITRSRSAVSSEGYSTVTGYDKFNDGVSISLTPVRLTRDIISLDFELSVSSFSDSDSDEDIPVSSKSSLTSPGLLLTDGGVYFVGSLRVSKKEKSLGIFTFNGNNSDEILTVWVKIREILYKTP